MINIARDNLHVPYGELKHSGNTTISAHSCCFARSMKDTARETFVGLSSPTVNCTNAKRNAEIHTAYFNRYLFNNPYVITSQRA